MRDTDRSLNLGQKTRTRLNKKQNLPFSGFCNSSESQSENKINQNNKKKMIEFCQRSENVEEHEVMVIPTVVGTLGMFLQSLEKNWRDWKSEGKSRPSRQQHC